MPLPHTSSSGSAGATLRRLYTATTPTAPHVRLPPTLLALPPRSSPFVALDGIAGPSRARCLAPRVLRRSFHTSAPTDRRGYSGLRIDAERYKPIPPPRNLPTNIQPRNIARTSGHLPPGYTFLPYHNDLPVRPLPEMARVYISDAPTPHLFRGTVFRYIFPHDGKGKIMEQPMHKPQRQALAFVDATTGENIFREELRVESEWLSNGLRQNGIIQRREVSAIFGPNSIEWLKALFACQAYLAIVTPVNAASQPHELLHQLRDSTARSIFIAPELLPVLDKALELGKEVGYRMPANRIVLLCPPDKKPAGTPYKALQELRNRQFKPKNVPGESENDTAFLCYSSGTTGRAKGVETTHHNMTSQISAFNKVYEPLYEDVDRVLAVLPFSHIYGLTTLCFQPISFGIPTFLLPRFDEKAFYEAIEKYKITWTLVAPPVLIVMLNSKIIQNYDLSSLRGMMVGAAPCSKELIERFEARMGQLRRPGQNRSCRITQGYGLTETSPVATTMRLTLGCRNPGSVGQLLPTFQARLVDPKTEIDVAEGAEGELWLRGPSVMKGYWRNIEATKAAFAEGGWFRTGDVAKRDKDGFFYIVDRAKELIKYKGYQVPPAELEALLLQNHLVADAGVIGIEDPEQATELPRAYIVPKAGLSGMSKEEQADVKREVARWVESRAARHKWLRGGIALVESIPKSPSGKILRKDLRVLAKREIAEGGMERREAKL